VKRLSISIALTVAALILLTGCPSVAKTRSLVGTWDLSVVRSQSETFLGTTSSLEIMAQFPGRPLRTISPLSIQATREEKRLTSRENSTRMG